MKRSFGGLETGSIPKPAKSFGVRSSALFLFSFLLFALPSTARSQVTLLAAVNGASYTQSGLPNGKLAQGVLFIAFGEGMGPASIERASTFPLPTSLAGTSISVTVGGVTADCIMLYTVAGQVAAILPSNVPTGTGTMTLTFNGVTSAPLSVTVVAHSFGVFAVNQGGSGPGVFLDAFTSVANGLTTSANPNGQWDIWGSGLGAVSGNEAAGPLPGDIAAADVHVFFGAVEAQVLYKGRSGCCSGVDQIRIVVPQVAGCYVPVYIVVNGVVSNFVSMSVAESGSTCLDPGGYSPELYSLIQGNGQLRLGAIGLSRFFVEGTTFAYQGDAATAGFSTFGAAALGGGSVPVAGSCTVVQFPTGTVPIPGGLDAGAEIPMMSPMGNYALVPPPFAPMGQYGLAFSPGSSGAPPSAGIVTDGTVLLPGNYRFDVPGGADVGSVSVNLDLPVKLEWTNPTPPGSTVSLGEPLKVTWANAAPDGLVFVNLMSSFAPGIGASATCWFAPGPGSGTVPAAIMSAIPPSYVDQSDDAQGTISVYQLIRGDNFTVSGIDIGIASMSDGYNIGQIKYQ